MENRRNGDHIVNLLYNGQMSGAIAFSIARAGATPLLADAQGHGHIYDAQGRINSRANPIRVNQPWVFYGGDYGRITGPELTAGTVTPSIALPAEQACAVRVGDNPATLAYCGLSPGSVVLYQTNFSLPSIRR